MPRDLIAYPDVELDEMGQVLMKAAEIVERGWCTGSFCRDYNLDIAGNDHYCAMGAILKVLGFDLDMPLDADATKCTQAYAKRMGFNMTRDFYAWNDDQSNAKPVAALMREAARAPRVIP